MKVTVHHQTINGGLSWNLHAWTTAWTGTSAWDVDGTPGGATVDFQLPDVPDPRKLLFKYNNVNTTTNATVWEPDSFVRRIFMTAPQEIWTFELSGRIAYQNPFPSGVTFKEGEVVAVNVITQGQFRGGQLYVWNPYSPNSPSAYFPESARDDATFNSTFNVTLAAWMTTGFHFKLMCPPRNGQDAVWEPDTSTRTWRPGDGNAIWTKSGENDVRNAPLTLTSFPVEVLFPASLGGAPTLVLKDLVEQIEFTVASSGVAPYGGDPLFNVGTYNAQIYPEASYNVYTTNGAESSEIDRPFPADPSSPGAVSRFVLGASAWVTDFPTIAPASVTIQAHGASCFGKGVTVQVCLGNAGTYQSVPATQSSGENWTANFKAVLNTQLSMRLVPVSGTEATPYPWIDTGRYFTAKAAGDVFYATEGVYGICQSAPTTFGDPQDRDALMRAAFGDAVVGAGVFAAREMPYGATLMNGKVYFVIHAPHAVSASLILVNEVAAGGPARVPLPMVLTNDTLYWWCQVQASQAPKDARYHFLLNDQDEVLDPAARAVQDRGESLTANFNDDPGNANTSWSMVVDVATVYASAHVQPWQTMGWQNLLIYEIHAFRFTDVNPAGLEPLDLLADELQEETKRGGPGYLLQLPVTVFELLPVTEFHNPQSWGYDPSFYFAIDGSYGGAVSMANFVNTAHAKGRGVMLDMVYNHSLGSSLMQIAPDVYRNGDYDGDRMNCGHPMVLEYFRQATIYLWRTFGLDGFRLDDTQTILTKSAGGWDFLNQIRTALRKAATAEGRAWPYCVAENSDNPWAISNPQWGVMDGQWEIDQSYRIRDVCYNSSHDGWDDSQPLANEMNQPSYWGRPFSQATRFGESHDMVSAQDSANQRIAARPPFGQGYSLAKAMGALILLSNGVPMLFMGQEVGTTLPFSFDQDSQAVNPLKLLPATAGDQTRILAWFTSLMGLRNDSTKGLQGDSNYQVVARGNRTVAFTCGAAQRLFVVVTFDTPNQQQNSGWLGLPGGVAFKEIFNSSWPDFQVSSEPEYSNGGYTAQIYSGQILNLPAIGAVVLEQV